MLLRLALKLKRRATQAHVSVASSVEREPYDAFMMRFAFVRLRLASELGVTPAFVKVCVQGFILSDF